MVRGQLINLICFISTVSGLLLHTQPDRLHPELGKHFEGDIIMTEGRNALLLKEYLWPNGIVPYVFHSNYTQEEKAKVKTGMQGIESKTCVKFVPRTNQADYIEIRQVPQMGCGAMVGRRPGRGTPMEVNYQAPECLQYTATIQHELLHVLGLFHEQARPDRDDYVTVLWDNIIPEFKTNFAPAPKHIATTYGIPYDFKSLMHYPNTAFSKNGQNTIVAKNDSSLVLGQFDGPTEYDLEKIRRLYNCASAQKGKQKSKHQLLSGLISKQKKH